MDEVGRFEGRERVGHGWGGGDRHCCDVGFYLMKGWRGVRCFKVGHGWGGYRHCCDVGRYWVSFK